MITIPLASSWEFLTTLDYEWSTIRGRRPYRWTIWVRNDAHFLSGFVTWPRTPASSALFRRSILLRAHPLLWPWSLAWWTLTLPPDTIAMYVHCVRCLYHVHPRPDKLRL
jgi:hypothetical protein